MEQTGINTSMEVRQGTLMNPQSFKKPQKQYNQVQNQSKNICQPYGNEVNENSKEKSQCLSQTDPQADQKIMFGLSLAEKRRYSNLLTSMGIGLKIVQNQQTMKQSPEQTQKQNKDTEQVIKHNPSTLQNINEWISTQTSQNKILKISLQNNLDSEVIQIQYNQIIFNQQITYKPLQQEIHIQNCEQVDQDVNQEVEIDGNNQKHSNGQALQNCEIDFTILSQDNVVEQNPKMQIQENYFPEQTSQQLITQPQQIQIDGPSRKQEYFRNNSPIKNLQTTQLELLILSQQNSGRYEQINLEMIRKIYTPASQKYCRRVRDNFQVQIDKQLNLELEEIKQFVNEIYILQQEQLKEKQIQVDEPQKQCLQQQHQMGRHSQISQIEDKSNHIFTLNNPPIKMQSQAVLFDTFNEGINEHKSEKQWKQQKLQVKNLPFIYQIVQVIQQNHQQNQKNAPENIDQKCVELPKQKRSSFSVAFRNSDLIKFGQNKENKRKFSDSSKSMNLNDIGNRISTSMKNQKNSNSQKSQQNQAGKQDQIDHKDTLNRNQIESRKMQVEQNIRQGSVVKKTSSNCFSNRSDRSPKSIHSNSSHSSYRYNRFIDTIQVPELSMLQIVKNSDGKQPRIQRRSSRGSHHSRSASTCKKSYDDLSQIHMQKIDESACQQLEDKSVKRSHHLHKRTGFSLSQDQNQKIQLENQISHHFDRSQQLDNNFSPQKGQAGLGQSSRKNYHFVKQNNQQKNYNSSVDTDLILPKNQEIKGENSDEPHNRNLSFQNTHQISYNPQNERSMPQIPEQIKQANEQFVICQDHKTYDISQSQRKLQQNHRLEVELQNKKKRLSHNRTFEIVIHNYPPIQQQFHRSIEYCVKFLEQTHEKSVYERQEYRKFIEMNFDVLGIQLDPKNDLALLLYHDGVFACSYIKYIKGLRNNSGMIESMMYFQFDDQIRIQTSKEFFTKEFKRVKQQRQMHYQNQFANRLKQYLDRNQVQKNQKSRKMRNSVSPQKQVAQVVDQRLNSASNISVAGSTDTITVDEYGDKQDSVIRRVTLSQANINRNTLIPEVNQEQYQHQKHQQHQQHQQHQRPVFQSFENLTTSITNGDSPIQYKQKKSDKIKKRLTKKKKKQIAQEIKFEEESQSQEQITISQIKQLLESKNILQENYQKSNSSLKKQKARQTKGILKLSKAGKDETKKQRKKHSQLSVSGEKSPKTTQSKSKNKNKNKNKTSRMKDDQHSSYKPTKHSIDKVNKKKQRLSSNKASMQKSGDQKVIQGKAVKFALSTKGGSNIQQNQRRNNFQGMVDSLQKEAVNRYQKKRLRSRSKK